MAIHFTKEEFSIRKSKVVDELKKQNLDALLMFKQESMYWLTGYDTFGYVFFQTLILTSKGDIILFLDIVLLVSFILMIDEPTDIEFSAGDINLDENLNILDVVAVVQLILNNNTLPEDCYIIPEVGPCDGICPTYYFNQNTNQCEEIGCGFGGFDSMQSCIDSCENAEIIIQMSENDYFGDAPDMGAFEFEGSTVIAGDLNGDGDLNIMDVIVLVNIILGYADPVDSGDLNADGNVNIMDVVALVQIILNP